MRRRTFLTGIGAAAAGASALLGTGAFTSTRASREVTVSVAGDADAYLSISGTESPNSQYVRTTSAGSHYLRSTDSTNTIRIDLGSGNDGVVGGGHGVNRNAVTWIDDMFRIANHGTRPVWVWIDVNHGGFKGEQMYFYDTETGKSLSVQNERVPSEGEQAVHLVPGESVSVGLNVDTHEEGNKHSLAVINAVADADEVVGIPAESP